MPLTLVTTPAATDANSYATVAEADAYAEVSFEASVWAAISTPAEKERLLVRATRLLDTLAVFAGTRSYASQPLQWPRTWVSNPAGTAYYDPTAIPSAVKDAQCQLALFLATQADASEDAFGGLSTTNLASLKVGSIDIEFREGSVTDGAEYFSRVILPILRAANCVRAGGRLTR